MKLLIKLYKSKILTFKGLKAFFISTVLYKVNFFTLLRFSKLLFSDKIAVQSKNQKLTFNSLYSDSIDVSKILFHNYSIYKSSKVAFVCANGIDFVKAIFASTYLGCDVTLFSPKINVQQFEKMFQNHRYDLIVFEDNLLNFEGIRSCLALSKLVNAISSKQELPKSTRGKLTLLTAGTSGVPKPVSRLLTARDYLFPFLVLVQKVPLENYTSTLLPLPIFHGFGLATFSMSLVLGSKTIFENNATELDSTKADLMVLTPSLLQKLLKEKSTVLSNIKCVLCGGESLKYESIKLLFNRHGPILYNLYGSTETGFSLLATPQDLEYNSFTIGKPIWGVKTQVLNHEKEQVKGNEIGELYLKNNWTHHKSQFLATGDLVSQDTKGNFYLKGRKDDRIISGGINVYPIELSNVLLTHSCVSDCEVIGVNDDKFGQRLIAFVVVTDSITSTQLMDWVRTKVSKHQMPKKILFLDTIPVNELGKVDRELLVLIE